MKHETFGRRARRTGAKSRGLALPALGAGCVLAATAGCVAEAHDPVVGNTLELSGALALAHAGDTIRLRPGNYGSIAIRRDLGGVTIESADPGRPARFANIQIVNGGGVTLKNLAFDVVPGSMGVEVTSARNVTMSGLDVRGQSIGPNAWAGKGIGVRDSTNVTVANSEFHELRFGIAHVNDQHLTVDNNYIHQISEDGVRGGGSSNVEVSGNLFTDFYRLGNVHPDAIQFWTANVKEPVHDIAVTNNIYIRGDGTATQGVFMGDEAHVGYQNVTITGNQIVGAMYHGITLYGGEGATISGNTVVGYEGQNSWIAAAQSNNVKVSGNTATHFKKVKDTLTDFDDNTTASPARVGDQSLLKAPLHELIKARLGRDAHGADQADAQGTGAKSADQDR